MHDDSSVAGGGGCRRQLHGGAGVDATTGRHGRPANVGATRRPVVACDRHHKGDAVHDGNDASSKGDANVAGGYRNGGGGSRHGRGHGRDRGRGRLGGGRGHGRDRGRGRVVTLRCHTVLAGRPAHHARVARARGRGCCPTTPP